MADPPGQEPDSAHPAARAIGTSIRGNSTAFGFSITITVSFGVLQRVEGSPTVTEMFLFAIAAALAIALLEGVVSRGFREAVGQSPVEVRLLGTAMDFVSIAAGVAAAFGVAELADGAVVWPAGVFAAVVTFIAAESVEFLLAERIQAARGDPRAVQKRE